MQHQGMPAAAEVPTQLLQKLKDTGLQVHAEQQQILEVYQDARSWLERHENAQATATSSDDASAAHHALDQDEPAVQGALVLLARLVHQLSRASNDQTAGHGGLPLSAIASAAGSNLFDMFREWPVVCGKLGEMLEQRSLIAKQLEAVGNILEWQKTLVAVALLSKKYKDLFNRYVHCQPEHKALVLKLGWTLYILLKAKLLPKFPDLVICMELLVCVMNVLVAHVSQLPAEIPPGPDGAINILDAISDALKADRNHVQELMLSVNPLFTQQLQSQCAGWLMGQASHPGAPRVMTGCTYLPGLLEDAERMVTITTSLEREYQVHFQKHGEIDEREMLFTDFARFASPRMTPGSVYRQPNGFSHQVGSPLVGAGGKAQFMGGVQAQAGQRLGPGSFVMAPPMLPGMLSTPTAGSGNTPTAMSMPLGMQSPMPIMQLGSSTATPITEALGSTAWLRGQTAGLKAEPTPNLLKCFAACVPNPTATIAKRVREMTEAVLPSEQQQVTGFPLVQPAIASYRREEAVKLYYHVLELVLASEERVAAAAAANNTRNGQPQAPPCYTTLLTSSKLHKGLMACSLELVMACYKMTSCPFPRVLEVINLHAFDLIKIVQTYVRHMPGMPLELKRHLYLMEEKTVETLAWQAGSSLYPLIITAQGNTGATSCPSPALPADTTRLASAAPGNSSTPVSSLPSSAGSDSDQPILSDGGNQQYSGSAVSVAGAGTAPAPARELGEVQVGPAAPSPSKRAAGAAHSMMSPLKRARGSDNSAITTTPAPAISDPLPAAVGRPPSAAALAALHPEAAAALTWLHDFLKKALKLAWFRLGFLCQSLAFGPHDPQVVRQKVYDTVEHAVYNHTNLLYNRHLDQVVLSALYGYCKVQHLGQITFKEIISQYRRQPQANQAVFRSVVLSQSNPGLQVISRGDIIAYYNQAFVPLMKQFLLKGGDAAPGAVHPSLGLPPMPPPATGLPRQAASPRTSLGAASPRPFAQQQPSAVVSPIGSPACGRPPLPPQAQIAADAACAVQVTIKQTISGFFPAMPKGAAGGGQATSPKPPQFGGGSTLLGKGAGGGLPTAPQAPAWPGSTKGPPGSAYPFGPPAMKAPSPTQRGEERELPSGIATLLRALDSTREMDDSVDTSHIAASGVMKQEGRASAMVASPADYD